MMSPNKIEIVLYQNASAILQLESLGMAEDAKVLVLELSASSVLAPVFDQQAKLRFGLAGLLGDSSRIDTLPKTFTKNRRSIVLGSRPTVSASASQSALANLKNMPSDYDRFVIMLHLSEVDRFLYSLQIADSFSVLLNQQDPVPMALIRAVKVLQQLEVLNASSWKGVGFYAEFGTENSVSSGLKASIEKFSSLFVKNQAPARA